MARHRPAPAPAGDGAAVTTFTVCVDPDRCQGHNRCVVVAPEVFTTDEFGYASVKTDATGVSLEVVQRAAQNCPERAITVTVVPSR